MSLTLVVLSREFIRTFDVTIDLNNAMFRI